MEIIAETIQEYAQKHSSPETEALRQVGIATMQSHPHAHMLSGHVQGKFLEMISMLMQPSYILEIGTFTGYSAICLSKGLKPGGKLHTIELREEDAATARNNFNNNGVQSIIDLHVGNAIELIPTLNYEWDIVFIDADKTNYTTYYKMVLPRVRKGGVIIADNVLFHGQVLQTPLKGKNAKAIQEFNEQVLHDEQVENVLLTIRDGLMFIVKK